MGMAMGQDCELLSEVCTWINAAATKPVWAKMTPNITGETHTHTYTHTPHHTRPIACNSVRARARARIFLGVKKALQTET